MALVRLRGPLKRRAGDRSEHLVDGATVGELLPRAGARAPAAGRLGPRRARRTARPRQRVRQRRAAARRTRGPADDRVDVSLRSRGGRRDRAAGRHEEGPVRARGRGRRRLSRSAARAFAGEPVEYAVRDPRSGRLFASVTSPFYGPKLCSPTIPAGEWEQARGRSPRGRRGRARADLGDRCRARPTACSSGRRPRRPVREPRRRRHAGSLNRALWEQPGRGSLAAGRAAGSACTRSPLAGRAGAAGGRHLGRRGLADRGRRRQLAQRQRGARRPATCPRTRRPTTRPLRRTTYTGRRTRPRAALHAVPRRRLPLGRRGRDLDRHRRGPAVGLRLPAGDRPGRPRQRLRDPAGRRRRPRHPGWPRAGLRDPRRRRQLDAARRRAAAASTPT